MNPDFPSIPLFTCLAMFLSLCAGGASNLNVVPRMEQDLARAEAYITSYRNDSASAILAPLMEDLEAGNQLNSPFGLRVQLQAVEDIKTLERNGFRKKIWA